MSLSRTAALIWLCAAPAVAEPLTVEIVTARAETDVRVYSLTGEVRARDRLSAAFPLSGRIVEVMVDAGARVAKGAVLARMDSVQQEQALRAAEAGLSTAAADHRQAIEDLERQEALLTRGATTRASRDSTEDALSVAEGALAQARAELDRARTALDDTLLLAPEEATVTRRMVEVGQVVGAAQPVMELALGTRFDAVFDVPEVLMTVGATPALIGLNRIDRPGERFEGHIYEISPVVDPQTGTVAVTVAVDDPPAGLDYGEAVRGTAEVVGKARVVLPHNAMSATAEGPAIWTVDPATMAVALRQVRIERFETGRIILAEGIEEGTLVVARGAQLLYPGRIVQAAEVVQ
ncbi:efflux RND transporter periplasmic adaptor subunit [Defluviimonas sp. WL0024]|uniref:Efflux RND transporter periplasmic adaptor subunit n=2 Tax=Albidovulum TaxID=205889 RepID=A0ABT3J7W8_9RHOB|nr:MULTISPECIES: efflux RND transporter periplasmic adaptor subunit [Defluviimonas]MCU9848865.1 efflux RND transporter periplasmic adaptor subunit [Defluviimonas sp. WL0024]MCW3783761.1 efflux RND transporter periplasmic adaptor subunit [Defluviimonas salinarum]